jgi:hypothetical protein
MEPTTQAFNNSHLPNGGWEFKWNMVRTNGKIEKQSFFVESEI